MAEAPSFTNSSLKLAGKVAIVTGGAIGIGKETARVFAEQGVRVVVIADIQDELGQQVVECIGSDKSAFIHCDVSDENQVINLIQSTVNIYGQIDIMVSNAGRGESLKGLGRTMARPQKSPNAAHGPWNLGESLVPMLPMLLVQLKWCTREQLVKIWVHFLLECIDFAMK